MNLPNRVPVLANPQEGSSTLSLSSAFHAISCCLLFITNSVTKLPGDFLNACPGLHSKLGNAATTVPPISPQPKQKRLSNRSNRPAAQPVVPRSFRRWRFRLIRESPQAQFVQRSTG